MQPMLGKDVDDRALSCLVVQLKPVRAPQKIWDKESKQQTAGASESFEGSTNASLMPCKNQRPDGLRSRESHGSSRVCRADVHLQEYGFNRLVFTGQLEPSSYASCGF